MFSLNYRCRTNLGSTSSINAHRSLLLLTTAAAVQGNTTYALTTQQYELCASSMGRGNRGGRRARKVHPAATQSLLPPRPTTTSLPLLLIVRVSTRRDIDFTIKFARRQYGWRGGGGGGTALKRKKKALRGPPRRMRTGIARDNSEPSHERTATRR